MNESQKTTWKSLGKKINKKRGRKLKDPGGNNIEIIPNSHRNVHDRNSDDNLKRKVKTHFHNYIIRLLNSKLKVKPGKEKLKFAKMQSKITQNITVEFNKKLFNKKIKDILKDVSNKYQNKDINSECIDYIMENNQLNSSLVDILNMTYKDLYVNFYLKSTKSDFNGEQDESYEYHKEKLRKKFGDEYLKKYIKNAENLIKFFDNCKKRKSKKNNNNNFLKVPLMIELDETKQEKNEDNGYVPYFFYEPKNNNKLNHEDMEYLGNNKISRGIQTEIQQVDEESDSE